VRDASSCPDAKQLAPELVDVHEFGATTRVDLAVTIAREMSRGLDHFQSLREVVPTEAVRASGTWVSKPQGRHVSPTQAGTGEGRFVETIDWQWDGTFETASPLAGIALLLRDERLYWVKSQPPIACPPVSFSVHGWAARSTCSVSVMGSFHGAFLPSMPVEIGQEPPVSCVIGQSAASTGTPHVVARVAGVVFAVLLLPSSAIKVGRNRLWRLREELARSLPPELHQIATRGRTGEITAP
jgi:hypothetical protein